MPADANPGRADLLADVTARREQLIVWKRRAQRVESIGGIVIALIAGATFRIFWTGGIFGMLLGASSWVFTLVVATGALVVARAAIATVAARRLVPARRDLVAAESRLFAHDAAFGRDR